MADIDSNLPTADKSDGIAGAAVPTTVQQVGGKDGSGNLRAISTDASGVVNTNLPTGAATSANQTNGTQLSRITDGTDTAAVTTNNQLKVVDGLKNGGVQGELTMTTANVAYEVKVGGSRLANRKFVTFTPSSTNIYWGYDNTVTTATGTPTSNGQFVTFACDPDSTFQVWVVGTTNNKTVRVTESP